MVKDGRKSFFRKDGKQYFVVLRAYGMYWTGRSELNGKEYIRARDYTKMKTCFPCSAWITIYFYWYPSSTLHCHSTYRQKSIPISCNHYIALGPDAQANSFLLFLPTFSRMKKAHARVSITYDIRIRVLHCCCFWCCCCHSSLSHARPI